jgi:hypothetical protein
MYFATPCLQESCYKFKNKIFYATREKLIENCVMYINFRKKIKITGS